MESPTATHSTFVIERTYTAAPERVYTAFANPAQKRRWFGEGDHRDVEHHEVDFRVGGEESSSFRIKDGPVKLGTLPARTTPIIWTWSPTAASYSPIACPSTANASRPRLPPSNSCPRPLEPASSSPIKERTSKAPTDR